mmetsp:Transcript_10705/g.31011  ORF Transcript_10705/g.31011 Transcript_10705/m.31011 type:complete len:297 (+) Transcript_10705:951-1841(+)
MLVLVFAFTCMMLRKHTHVRTHSIEVYAQTFNAPFTRVRDGMDRQDVWIWQHWVIAHLGEPPFDFRWDSLTESITGDLNQEDERQIDQDVRRLRNPNERRPLREVLQLYARKYPEDEITQKNGYRQEMGHVANFILDHVMDQGKSYVIFAALAELHVPHFQNPHDDQARTTFINKMQRVAPFLWQKCEGADESYFNYMHDKYYLTLCTNCEMFSVDTKLMIVDAIFCCESAQRATDAVIEVLYRKANEFFQAEYLEDSDIDKLLQKFQQHAFASFGQNPNLVFHLMSAVALQPGPQ